MSNRCYLYSTNFVPGLEVTEYRRAIGIASWSYDIPIVYKLLLSSNPRICRSLIFEGADEFALIGDYAKGVECMLRFLVRVSHPAVAEAMEQALEFLEAEENKNAYFVLEPGEIFDVLPESLPDEYRKLLAEIQNLQPQMDKAIAELEARMWEEDHPPGFFARLLGARTPVRKNDSTDLVYGLGLGGWSNVLFYEPKLE
jgi:hypothetical protein